jgi:hypothetical protein
LGAAKKLAIGAHARLMRLTHQDGALVTEYARARMAAVAVKLFGPTHGMDENRARQQINRLYPQHAADLNEALQAIANLSPHTNASDAIHHVDNLENVLEHIQNDT